MSPRSGGNDRAELCIRRPTPTAVGSRYQAPTSSPPNSPRHTISRLVAGGQNIVLDLPVAAQTVGAPIDIAANGDLLAVVESNGGAVSRLTPFSIDADGNLTQTASSVIGSAANGVAIVPAR